MSHIAWHFLNKDKKLGYGDNRLVEVGKTYSCEGDPVLCGNGMHGSSKAIDALSYAKSSIITLTEIRGKVIVGDDKIVGKTRKVLRMADASDLLFEFSCIVAENALNFIKKNGGKADERSYAAIQARRNFQKKLISKKELIASGNAARAAERDATSDAEWAAARAAEWAAARDAEWAAARDAAWDAAGAAEWDAERAATRDAARDAAWDEQNKILEKMLWKLLHG